MGKFSNKFDAAQEKKQREQEYADKSEWNRKRREEREESGTGSKSSVPSSASESGAYSGGTGRFSERYDRAQKAKAYGSAYEAAVKEYRKQAAYDLGAESVRDEKKALRDPATLENARLYSKYAGEYGSLSPAAGSSSPVPLSLPGEISFNHSLAS